MAYIHVRKDVALSENSFRFWYFILGTLMGLIGFFSLETRLFGWNVDAFVRASFMFGGLTNFLAATTIRSRYTRRLATVVTVAILSARSFSFMALDTPVLSRGASFTSGVTYVALTHAAVFIYLGSVVTLDRKSRIRGS
jgi:hypothetical protein